MTERARDPVIRSLSLSSELAEVARARRFVAEVATEAGFAESRVFDVMLVSSEAAANAVEHAPVKGHVQVRTLLYPDRLEVQVAGPGEFQTPDRLKDRRNRGLGLPLMAKLSDHLALYSGPQGGTLVSLIFYRPGMEERAEAHLPPSIQELIEENELVSAITEKAPVGLFVLDPDLRFRWTNSAYRTFLDEPYGSHDLTGLYIRDVVPGSEQTGAVAILREVSETGEPVFLPEYEFEGFARGLTYWRWEVLPLEQHSTPPYDVLVVISEITEETARRRQMEVLAEEARLAADAYREEGGRLQAVLQQMPSGVIIAEAPSGRLLTGNSQVARIWRHEFVASENVADYSAYKGFHADGRPYEAGEWPLARSLESGETVSNEEIRILRGDGTLGTILVSSSPIVNEAGDVVAAVIVFDEITERKLVEEALRESEARLRSDKALFRGVADIFEEALSDRGEKELGDVCLEVAEEITGSSIGFIGETTPDGRLHNIAASDSQWATPGRSPGDLGLRTSGDGTGHSLIAQVLRGRSLVSERPHLLGPPEGPSPDHPVLDAVLAVPLRRKEEIVGMAAVGNRDGGYGPEQVEILEALGPIVVEAFDRKRAEVALRESEERLSLALETSHTGAWDVDLAERSVQRSLAHDRIFGYDLLVPGWTYDTFLEHVLSEDRPAVEESFRAATAEQAESGFECRIRRADGEIRWISVRGQYRLGGDGGPHLAGIVQDITERKVAEEELRESEARYRLLAEENERLYRQQLDIAESLQSALLDIPAEMGGVALGHLYRSATQAARVGGDFYDAFPVKGGHIAVLIGDVSGHGIEAARTATLVKDVVHAFAHQSLRTNEVLKRTNGLLVEKELPGFVTLFLGILDGDTGRFRYASAGHPEALLRRVDGEVQVLGSGSAPLGVYAQASWKPAEVVLEAGDLLLLYTDGVLEARREDGFFGEKRLQRILKRKRISAQTLPQLVLDQVLAFSGGTLTDDIAVLALSLIGAAQSSSSAAGSTAMLAR